MCIDIFYCDYDGFAIISAMIQKCANVKQIAEWLWEFVIDEYIKYIIHTQRKKNKYLVYARILNCIQFVLQSVCLMYSIICEINEGKILLSVCDTIMPMCRNNALNKMYKKKIECFVVQADMWLRHDREKKTTEVAHCTLND